MSIRRVRIDCFLRSKRLAVVRRSVIEKLAWNMLAEHGLPIIWRLHSDAAILHRIGNATAARTFVEIADLAEEWVFCRQGAGMGFPATRTAGRCLEPEDEENPTQLG